MQKESCAIRVVIADDHPVFRHGLRKVLETERAFALVGEAADGAEAVDLARRVQPDVLLLDLAMPRVPGLEALRDLMDAAISVRTILLTAAIGQADIVRALQLGARGIVLKDADPDVLFAAIRTVMAGEYWVGRERVRGLMDALGRVAPRGAAADGPQRFRLTPRELEIVSTVVSGYTNRDIAQKLSVSEETVKHHLTNIFDKVGVHSRLELALFALHHRLVDPAL